MKTPVKKRSGLNDRSASEQKTTKIVVKSEPNANQFIRVPDFESFIRKSVVNGKSSGDISTVLATTPPATAAPKQKKGGKKRKGKGPAVKKPKAITKKNEANHGSPVVELGQGKVMTKHLIYNRAYKRVRLAEVKKGTKDDEAKQMAAEQARNAVSIFLDGLQT